MTDLQEILNEPLNKDGILYSIDEKEGTASLIGTKIMEKKLLIIPRSFRHKSKEYIVTSISKNAFYEYHNEVQFANDSELRTLKKGSFNYCYIKKITFPSSLSELEEGWCEKFRDFNSIKIDSKKSIFQNIRQ